MRTLPGLHNGNTSRPLVIPPPDLLGCEPATPTWADPSIAQALLVLVDIVVWLRASDPLMVWRNKAATTLQNLSG